MVMTVTKIIDVLCIFLKWDAKGLAYVRLQLGLLSWGEFMVKISVNWMIYV